jgi:hypothetical protein
LSITLIVGARGRRCARNGAAEASARYYLDMRVGGRTLMGLAVRGVSVSSTLDGQARQMWSLSPLEMMT